jgi:hypothetical protein
VCVCVCVFVCVCVCVCVKERKKGESISPAALPACCDCCVEAVHVGHDTPQLQIRQQANRLFPLAALCTRRNRRGEGHHVGPREGAGWPVSQTVSFIKLGLVEALDVFGEQQDSQA